MGWLSDWGEGYVARLQEAEERAASRRADEEGRTMRCYDELKAPGQAPNSPYPDKVAREIDSFVEAETEQMGMASSIMRRIEDLADRVLGSSPATPGEKPAPASIRSGHFGGLLDAHETRDAIYRRTMDALTRIEKVL